MNTEPTQHDGLIGGGAPERQPYSPPAIIYSGELTTRAGSLIPGNGMDYDVDVATLFGQVE